MTVITGNGGNNVLLGTSMDDEIFGLQGEDLLIGYAGNDTLNGGSGADNMQGGIDNDTYVVDHIDDGVFEYENKGDDTIRASITYKLVLPQHVENLILTDSDDIDGYGNGLENNIYGNSGDNDLWGLGGNDLLSGGAGDDYLNGGNNNDNDTMRGGSGDDYYVVSNGDTVTEYAGQGIDTVESFLTHTLGANVENLILTNANNIDGYGNELHNEITGNSGNNYLYGGGSTDVMRGGAGNDTYHVDHLGDSVTELSDEGIDTVRAEISGYGLGANLENLRLLGSGNLTGYGNSLDNEMIGNSGNNTLFGNGGNDILIGGSGADTMFGGEGDDEYRVDAAGDLVSEQVDKGIDSVYTWEDMDYTLPAHVENLYLDYFGDYNDGTGNALKNIIEGSVSDNVLDGGGDQDWMEGFWGDDDYYVDNELDAAVEGFSGGYDVVFSTVNYTIDDHIEVLSLAIGNAVAGTGNAQGNTIFGNAGNNVLDGGGGSDSLSGLGGNDTFVFQAGQANGDVVYEFEGNGAGLGDVLKFVGYGPGATLNQMTATEWIVASADNSISEVFTLVGAPALDDLDYVFV